MCVCGGGGGSVRGFNQREYIARKCLTELNFSQWLFKMLHTTSREKDLVILCQAISVVICLVGK